MAEKRVIEYEAASAVENDDWLLLDGVTEGTRKIRPSVMNGDITSAITTLQGDVGDLADNFAEEYDSSESYAVGDYCTHENILYVCTGATTGTWDGTKWTSTDVAEIAENSGKVNDVQVNGTSVVTNKVASIDLTGMQADIDSKQADTKIGGASILDNNKTANLDFLASYGEASGSIASFNDGAAMPLKSLKVGIEAVQAGTGDPSPTNVRPFTGWSAVNVVDTSVNLLGGTALVDAIHATMPSATVDTTEETISFNGSTDTSANKVISGSVVFKPNTQYTFINIGTTGAKGNFRWLYTDGTNDTATDVVIGAYVSKANKSVEALIKINNSNQSTVLKYNTCGIFEGAITTDDFVAYNGTTTPIAFIVNGETKTIYSGYVEIKNGKVKAVAESAMVDLGALSWSKSSVSGKTYFITKNEIADAKKSTGINYIQGILCSNYKEDTWAHVLNTPGYDGYICLGWGNRSFIAVNDTRYNDSTASEFKTSLNGVQLVYPLATPIEYELADVSISTQDGINSIWADTGDILECKYVRDNSAVINDLIARVTALENA